MSREKIQKSITCEHCGGIFIISVDKENHENWEKGEFIQDALKENTAAERELLVSATCGDCWNKMFPDYCDDDDTNDDDDYSCMEQEYEDFN